MQNSEAQMEELLKRVLDRTQYFTTTDVDNEDHEEQEVHVIEVCVDFESSGCAGALAKEEVPEPETLADVLMTFAKTMRKLLPSSAPRLRVDLVTCLGHICDGNPPPTRWQMSVWKGLGKRMQEWSDARRTGTEKASDALKGEDKNSWRFRTIERGRFKVALVISEADALAVSTSMTGVLEKGQAPQARLRWRIQLHPETLAPEAPLLYRGAGETQDTQGTQETQETQGGSDEAAARLPTITKYITVAEEEYDGMMAAIKSCRKPKNFKTSITDKWGVRTAVAYDVAKGRLYEVKSDRTIIDPRTLKKRCSSSENDDASCSIQTYTPEGDCLLAGNMRLYDQLSNWMRLTHNHVPRSQKIKIRIRASSNGLLC